MTDDTFRLEPRPLTPPVYVATDCKCCQMAGFRHRIRRLKNDKWCHELFIYCPVKCSCHLQEEMTVFIIGGPKR